VDRGAADGSHQRITRGASAAYAAREPAAPRIGRKDVRLATPMYSHISPYGTFLLDMHTRLELERPEEAAHTRRERDAAQATGRAVKPPRTARTPV
jgi:hypothetical protein